MRKLVLGILAVFCLQFAFVIFTALQSPLEVAVAPIYSDLSTGFLNFEPSETAVADDVDATLTETEDTIETAKPKAVNERLIASPRRSQPAARPAADETAASVQATEKRPARYFTESSDPAGVFATVVISFDRSSAISDCEMNEIPKAKKRSYIAKAAPVIKKPWEWIKAVGSKFD